MIEVRVPTTGNAGEDAVLLEWLVDTGAEVRTGDPLATIETAKAVHEVTSTADGVLIKQCIDEGGDAAEFALLAWVGAAGETAPDGDTAAPAAPVADAAPAPEAAPVAAPPARDGRIAVSPRAALLAERSGVDLTVLVGTGPNGRIIVPDVIAGRDRAGAAPAAPQSAPASAPAAPAAPAPVTAAAPAAAAYDTVPVTGARKVTAQRMHASLATTAQVTLTRYADAAKLMEFLGRLRAAPERLGIPRVTVTDLVLYATARAIAKHPEINASFSDTEIRRYRTVNLGVAVDTGTALLVPVIPDAQTLTVTELAAASAALAEKARAGRLTMAEMDNGTFTVSSLGGLGVHWFTPVLNPPQVGILGVGRALPASPAGAHMLPLSLTFDHRALDGAAAAIVLADIASSIESVDLLGAI